jgi:hypothetical protein
VRVGDRVTVGDREATIEKLWTAWVWAGVKKVPLGQVTVRFEDGTVRVVPPREVSIPWS